MFEQCTIVQNCPAGAARAGRPSYTDRHKSEVTAASPLKGTAASDLFLSVYEPAASGVRPRSVAVVEDAGAAGGTVLAKPGATAGPA